MKPVKSVEFSSTPKILVLFLSMLWHTPLWAENTTPTQSVQMDTITVKAHRNRDKSGYTQVYSRDISNMYKGKQEIETYRGSSVADLIGGMAGVTAATARNSGGARPQQTRHSGRRQSSSNGRRHGTGNQRMARI